LICENAEAVHKAIHGLNTCEYKSTSSFDNDLPVIAYILTTAVGKKLRAIDNLYTKLSNTFEFDVRNEVSIINVHDTFVIQINRVLAPAIYVTDNKHICELQSVGQLNGYIMLDDGDVVLTNSTFHSMSLYRKYLDFVDKADVTIEDALDLFNTIYETVSKYVSVLKTINTGDLSRVQNSQPSVNDVYLNLDKYAIPCDHTALTTDEWYE